MKTDRELLVLAAKAAGNNAIFCDNVGPKKLSGFWIDDSRQTTENSNPRFIPKLWNPLTDDGDALRLAVKLRMRIATPTTDTDCAIAGFGDVRGVHVKAYSEDAITDIYAATRSAIVRAAAEIGKTMEKRNG